MKLVNVGVDHDAFREMEIGRMMELMGSPVVVDCKNLIKEKELFIWGLGRVIRTISRNLFILAHQLGDRNFYPTNKWLVQNQWRSYGQLKKEQEKRLRAMINFAYKNVPYYHKLFDDLKLSPDAIKRVEDLEKLHILTKEIIKPNWDDFCYTRGEK